VVPDTGSTPSADPAASPRERLHAIEHAVEEAVEHAIEATERSLARRFGDGCVRGLHVALRTVVVVAVVGYFIFGAALLGLRYGVMPRIDELRPWLEGEASKSIGAQLTIGRIEAGWRGFNPRLTLRDVRLTGRAGEARLALPQVDAEISWRSVPRMSLQFASLSVLAPELEVRRLGPARFSIAGFVIEPKIGETRSDAPLLDWVLDQSRIRVRDARVVYVDEAGGAADAPVPTHAFTDVQVLLLGGITSTQLSVQARPPAELAARIDLRGSFRHAWLKSATDLSAWRGQVYVELDSADLARTEAAARVLPPAMRIERAQGALRAWINFEQAALKRVAADVALSDLRAVAGADLAPLEVAALQGRFTQLEWGNAFRGGQELQLQGFTLHGKGLSLPPTDLRYRYTRGSSGKGEDAAVGGEARLPRTEFEASLLSLDTLTQLAAHVPLARDLQRLVARQAVRGTLTGLKLDFDGAIDAPDRFALHSRFHGLSMSAQPAEPARDASQRPRAGQPGFTNLAGSIDLTEAGGSIGIDAHSAVVEFPGVFEDPRLAFDRLIAQARWSRLGDRLEVQLQSLVAANADLDFTATGSYQRSTAADGGPGSIDLTARVSGLNVAAANRYVPLASGPQTRAWLGRALAGGRGSDGMVRLRGDLREFPFRDARRGEFRASVRVRDAILDYLPAGTRDDGTPRIAWPRLQDIDADVVFERQGMTVTARGARIFGTRVLSATAQVADLNAVDSTLAVRGSTSGPAADLLRYVNSSGLSEPLRFLAASRATGSARLDLKLDLPLHHAGDTTVAGSIQLASNDIVLRNDIPPFLRSNGRIEFTRRTLALTGVSATFLGGPLTASATTRPDGAIVITGAGSAMPAGVAGLVDVPVVRRALGRTQGSARYNGTLTLRDGRTDLRVDSDLSGWAIDLPAPLSKSSADSLPLRVELAGLGTDRDRIDITAGSTLGVRLERTRAGERGMRIERGVIAVGEIATLPQRGLIANINVPRLDLDAWQPVLEGRDDAAATRGAPAAAETGAALPDYVNLRTRELLISGKPIANLVLGATRLTDGRDTLWQANVSSDQVNGALTWRPAGAGGSGRISARLVRLSIPESQRTQVAQLLDAPPTSVPGFDVMADAFELGGKALGRLELVAVNGGTPSQPVWNLQKLEISNPDARLSASGSWQRKAGQATRHMALTLGLDFSNGGALLARLGIPDALRGGQGRLEGDLGWDGSPLSINYPTLSGDLKLNSNKGQFLKASAGAGRLLGVLSLQSLPRRMTLDFRDVFSEGFAFDSISATAQVKSGVLSTRDFRMRGASANVLIEGSADIGRETQDLHVLVLPEINAGSASLAYALLANPAIGLGTFLAQLLLRDPLSKAFSFEYDVTGTWVDPQVKRRERSAPEGADAQK